MLCHIRHYRHPFVLLYNRAHHYVLVHNSFIPFVRSHNIYLIPLGMLYNISPSLATYYINLLLSNMFIISPSVHRSCVSAARAGFLEWPSKSHNPIQQESGSAVTAVFGMSPQASCILCKWVACILMGKPEVGQEVHRTLPCILTGTLHRSTCNHQYMWFCKIQPK